MMHTKKLTESVKFSDQQILEGKKKLVIQETYISLNIKTCCPLHYYLINYRKLANLLRNKNYKS